MVSTGGQPSPQPRRVVVVGGGPAGLMAAEVVASAGHHVTIADRMPTFGRKLLMAGRGGLNLTHSEDLEALLARYGEARGWLEAPIRAFPPSALIAFVEGLGQATFVGTSGRIFPRAMKASPLLRAWLARLRRAGVTLEPRLQWTGMAEAGTLAFSNPDGPGRQLTADAVILALGGASWPRLGSDGGWTATLGSWGVSCTPLLASNCGVQIAWTPLLRDRFQGQPIKRINLTTGGERHRGEAVITASGLEGGAVYACSAAIRVSLATGGAELGIDLRPDSTLPQLAGLLSRPRGKQSVATLLRKTIALSPLEVALLHECRGRALPAEPALLAALIKDVRLTVTGLAPIDRAISSTGGIEPRELDAGFMLRQRPGVFVAGEMLDWDAPTGGYLLQACLSTGHAAGRGAVDWLASGHSLLDDPHAGLVPIEHEAAGMPDRRGSATAAG